MENSDGIRIQASLIHNRIQEYIWNINWFDEIIKFDYLEFEHLWPDLIWISEQKIYWIEHFYVDASKIINRKWNELQIEYSKNVKRNIIPKIEKALENKDISSKSYKFQSSLNYENLKHNTLRNFENHYKKIEEYNNNIRKKYWSYKNIEIIFYIEYNILPSIFIMDWLPDEKYIYPFFDINFLNYFTDKKEIKWIIFSVDNQNYYVQIMDKYTVDNIKIFDFSNWYIDDFDMNQIIVWMKIDK